MATVAELTKQLVGNGYKQPSANDIRRAHRGKSRLVVNQSTGLKQLVGTNMGVVRSQFDAVSSAPVSSGDIAKSAITAERLAGVGRDSETDTTGFKEQNRAAHEAAQERRRQERERVDAAKERNGQGQDDWEDEVQQGIGEDAPEETEQAYQAELESERERIAEAQHSSNRGKTKPTGLMAVNAEYARRRGAQVATMS